jgi:hypothetical protein
LTFTRPTIRLLWVEVDGTALADGSVEGGVVDGLLLDGVVEGVVGMARGVRAVGPLAGTVVVGAVADGTIVAMTGTALPVLVGGSRTKSTAPMPAAPSAKPTTPATITRQRWLDGLGAGGGGAVNGPMYDGGSRDGGGGSIDDGAGGPDAGGAWGMGNDQRSWGGREVSEGTAAPLSDATKYGGEQARPPGTVGTTGS